MNSKQNLTKIIYELIAEEKYADVIEIIGQFQTEFPRSRALLSLMGYSFYMSQDFVSALDCYSQLCELFPNQVDYKLYHAQSLFKAGYYDECLRICSKLKSIQNTDTSLSLQVKSLREKIHSLIVAAHYEQNDHAACLSSLQGENLRGIEVHSFDYDSLVTKGCVLFKQNQIQEAKQTFENALKRFKSVDEYDESTMTVLYNLALTEYKLEDYTAAEKTTKKLIQLSEKYFPILSSKESKDDSEAVDNTQRLKDSVLVEAYNLLFAIQYSSDNENAYLALNKLPKREESALDPVTLHNSALAVVGKKCDGDFTKCVRKLTFLLDNPPFPEETSKNLLNLYCKFGYFDLAADLLAETKASKIPTGRPITSYDSRTQDNETSFLQGVIELNGDKASMEEGYLTLAQILAEREKKLKVCYKEISSLRSDHSTRDKMQQAITADKLKQCLKEYESEMKLYLPCLMQVAKAHWKQQNYDIVEKLLQRGGEFCMDSMIWQMNLGHCFFMQEERYKDCIGYYEEILKASQRPNSLDEIFAESKDPTSVMEKFGFNAYEDMDESGSLAVDVEESKADLTKPTLLNVTAIVLANLCVAYIMTSDNEKAEELMKRLEQEEEMELMKNPNTQIFHLCIVNLVIGTLYCSKGNYEFGISRIVKSLEPYERKLGTDTWFYAKRGFLSLADTLTKGTSVLPNATVIEVLKCLDQVERYGSGIATKVSLEADDEEQKKDKSVNSVSSEARLLKQQFVRVLARA